VKLLRRQFLHLAACATALPAMSRIARAQAYPTRPVRLVSPAPAGSIGDILGRPLAQWLQDRLGRSFLLENRPGAAGNIGTEMVVRASPDGYTLLLVTGSNTANATLYDKLSFNFIRDIAPVASISREATVMLVHPSVPAKTVPEFIAYAKANPGKINFASAGIGSASHLAGEMFKMMTGVNMLHVPYRGSPLALTDMLGGQVQLYFTAIVASIGYIRAGQLRPLAVAMATRSQALPDVPTMDEFVPGFEASLVYGIGAPKNTPAEIVDKLNKEINAALADPKIKAQLELTGTVLSGSPADFGKLIAEETEKWGKVVKFAGIKPE
jgi:tripartite-type tricarboxylate transporter receptor subunit TctC